jgi:NAD(P)-dependent dehydrogenase (short-subunit alcohol dehydrogenase family)
MDLRLADKRALVTGSTAGIGFAIARTLAAEGALVVVNGRTQAAVDTARAAIADATPRRVDGFAGDLSQAALVAYVASPLASATTGAALRVDGGVVRSPLLGGSSP